MLAPIVLFVYNRPEHTFKTLKALGKNSLAKDSTLYIFADGVKEKSTILEIESIAKVRKIINETVSCGKVIIQEREHNIGLANSVIFGVTEIIKKYGKIIVLEDDIVCSPFFLEYMNEGLVQYVDNEDVKQISGYLPNVISFKQNSAGFIPVTSTWGWATWERVWSKVDFDALDYKVLKIDNLMRKDFNLSNKIDYSTMLEMQIESDIISSWGILFWWDIFKRKGLVLYPDFSLVSNIGFDGTGTHYTKKNSTKIFQFDKKYKINKFPQIIELDIIFYDAFLSQYTPKPNNILKKIIKKFLK